MSLVGLSGESFRRYPHVFGTRGGLQDVKEIKADRLLDFYGAALYAVFPDVPDSDIAPAPEVVHVKMTATRGNTAAIS